MTIVFTYFDNNLWVKSHLLHQQMGSQRSSWESLICCLKDFSKNGYSIQTVLCIAMVHRKDPG